MKAIATRDHKGNKFPSVYAMCDHYKIPHNLYYARRKLGWDLETTLTTPPNVRRSNKPVRKKERIIPLFRSGPCKDHLGNEYPSKSRMCISYGITSRQFDTRVKHGWTLEEALTTPIQGTK